MTHSKIIFLDVDGVINVGQDDYQFFNEQCLEQLRWLINHTGAKVVISSSWREGDLEKTKKHFPIWLRKHIIGETVRGYHNVVEGSSLPIVRGNEIKHWVDRNLRYPWHVRPSLTKEYSEYNDDGWFVKMRANVVNVDYHYVIFDDDSDMLLEQAPHFVQTDPEVGLTHDNVFDAQRILTTLA